MGVADAPCKTQMNCIVAKLPILVSRTSMNTCCLKIKFRELEVLQV